MSRHIMRHAFGCLLLSTATLSAGEALVYESNKTKMEGYIAYPDAEKFPGDRPAILIAHQWKGLSSYGKPAQICWLTLDTLPLQ